MTLTIALPVLNEEAVLQRSVVAVREAAASLGSAWQPTVVIADNGSEDMTARIGLELAATYPDVRYLHIPARGKGLAIRTAWETHPAEVLVFMDADLATGIAALPALVEGVAEAGMAVGSRYLPASRVRRPWLRSVMSRGYQLATWIALRLPVKDAPCGFKAIRGEVWQQLAPHVRNTSWFFDTELLCLAYRAGHRVQEVPVSWVDGGPYQRPSRAVPWRIIREYVGELRRLRTGA